MSRLLYEQSVSYNGYLIIPFVLNKAESQSIYSYKLLSELGHKNKLHKADNPGGIYANKLELIVDIAKKYLQEHSDTVSTIDYFKHRYTYRNDLIIIYEEAGKYFYDHYKPYSLNNVAAPKIFVSEQDCINWVKAGLDRSYLVDGNKRGRELRSSEQEE
ncbi:MAG: hypothetical protein F6K14_07750 [Symploca sp. SIO2C1]|nr:hypothetical protein [Symploca sp. SIO2C1]